MRKFPILRFAWRRVANATPKLISIFSACPLLISGFLSASGCEVPTKVISAVLGTSGQPQTSEPPHEYKILLSPPNYENLPATKEHIVFTTILTRLIYLEAASRSHHRCDIIASTSLFPNIRVVITGASEPGCLDSVRKILSDFTPTSELIGKIASSVAREKKADSINPVGYMSEAENILAEALRNIYEEGSVMRALVSLSAENFESISASSFLQWLQKQRFDGSAVIAPLEICKSDEEISNTRPSNGEMPYSNIIPPQTLALMIPQPAHTRKLSHVTLVGGGGGPVNSPLRSAATRKYCSRENKFLVGTEHSFAARTHCLVEVVRNTDTWVIFFCDPQDCSSSDMAEKVAAAIAVDADVIEFGKKNALNDQVRGPYSITIKRTDK